MNAGFCCVNWTDIQPKVEAIEQRALVDIFDAALAYRLIFLYPFD